MLNHKPQEGSATVAVEKKTSKIPPARSPAGVLGKIFRIPFSSTLISFPMRHTGWYSHLGSPIRRSRRNPAWRVNNRIMFVAPSLHLCSRRYFLQSKSCNCSNIYARTFPVFICCILQSLDLPDKRYSKHFFRNACGIFGFA